MCSCIIIIELINFLLLIVFCFGVWPGGATQMRAALLLCVLALRTDDRERAVDSFVHACLVNELFVFDYAWNFSRNLLMSLEMFSLNIKR